MDIASIQQLTTDDLTRVDHLIHQQLQSSVPLANEIAEYIVDSGGKRLRPILVILSAKAFGYQGHDHLKLAAIVEMLHTATLLHDDVIDHSTMRRGKKTANALWGSEASILVGDLLHARSFQLIAELNLKAINDILAVATGVIVEGELLQMIHCHDPKTTEETYLEIIQDKTGKLFEVSTHVGPLLAEANNTSCQAMADYGRYLGAAFQIADDALDYLGDTKNIGKNIGDDLAEGKPTLPLIYILNNGNKQQRETIKQALHNQNNANIKTIQEIIEQTNAIEYTLNCAKNFVNKAQKALTHAPSNPYCNALRYLADYAIIRNS